MRIDRYAMPTPPQAAPQRTPPQVRNLVTSGGSAKPSGELLPKASQGSMAAGTTGHAIETGVTDVLEGIGVAAGVVALAAAAPEIVLLAGGIGLVTGALSVVNDVFKNNNGYYGKSAAGQAQFHTDLVLDAVGTVASGPDTVIGLIGKGAEATKDISSATSALARGSTILSAHLSLANGLNGVVQQLTGGR